MTTIKTTPAKKTGDRPTHYLNVKSDQLGKPVNFRIGAIWAKETHMGFRLNSLVLKQTKEGKGGQPQYLLVSKTKHYGQEAELQVATFSSSTLEGEFECNFGELVAFKNEPRPEGSKPASSNQPKP